MTSTPKDPSWHATPHRVLVIEDERPARAKLKRLLQQDLRFAWVGEACNGIEGLQHIEALPPDLLVLDVQMPGCDGFEMLAALKPELEYSVIFVTAHDAHALRAFEAHALDYLLKPYDSTRFTQALDKVHQQRLGGALLNRSLSTIAREATSTASDHRRLILKTPQGWRSISMDDIVRLSANGKHVEITDNLGTYVVRSSLRSLKERLRGHGFVQVHRGEIVRTKAVIHVESLEHGDAVLTLTNGTAVNLSRKRRSEFFRCFGNGTSSSP